MLRTVPTFIDCVTDMTILGEGSSGLVYRGMYRGMACVVKLPKSITLTGAAWREWQCHLCLPPHPHLIRFLGALPMSATNYLVLSFVRQGSLHSLLASSTASSVWYSRPYAVMRCARDMCAVLRHMHDCHIVHRDVACRNILVDSDGGMVLADLGLAQQCLQPADRQSHTPAMDQSQTAVPVRWTSPQSLSDTAHYDSKSDVWSLGVALWECTACGRVPYMEYSRNTKHIIRPVVAGELRLEVADTWGMDDSLSEAELRLAGRVKRLIQLCLTYEVEHRPDSEQLQAVVEKEWEEWKAEEGEQAGWLEREWVEYHKDIQQRLGPPAVQSSSTSSAS